VTVADATTHPEESGTFFVLPPHHRLFAVVDDPVAGTALAAELRAQGDDDVWTFFGEKGIGDLDPHVRHHGVPLAIVRVLQRLLTNDCEYCEGLASALEQGAIVLAIRVAEEGVDDLSAWLRDRGAHSLAFGEHWNFVPVGGSGHAIGFTTSEGPETDAR